MSSVSFQIKVCGVTNAADAAMCAFAGCDALGLNFYPASSRYITPDQASDIAKAIPAGVTKVGVFVNAELDEVRGRYEDIGLDFVQIHGDEPPEYLADLAAASIPCMRAFRCGADFGPVVSYLDRCRELSAMPERILLDAQQHGAYGGTGKTADWNAIATARIRFKEIPFVLAGGLTPENVAEAIALVRPVAVDTASGVESSPGKKCRELVCAFVSAAHAGFSSRAAF